jgi:hypothetical protein
MTHCAMFLAVAKMKQNSSLTITKFRNLVYRLVCQAEHKVSETDPGPVIESDLSKGDS